MEELANEVKINSVSQSENSERPENQEVTLITQKSAI